MISNRKAQGWVFIEDQMGKKEDPGDPILHSRQCLFNGLLDLGLSNPESIKLLLPLSLLFGVLPGNTFNHLLDNYPHPGHTLVDL